MTGSPDRGVWTLAEIRNGRVHEISGELLAWGRSLADSLGAPLVSVVPESVPDGDLDGLVAWGADVVIVLDSQEGTLPEDLLCPLLARLVRRHTPEIFIASATTTGRTAFSMLYAELETGLTADCTGLRVDEKTGMLLQTRPAIGGNVMATIKTPLHRPQMCTVRPRSMKPLVMDPSRRGRIVRETVEERSFVSRLEVLDSIRDVGRGTPISEADILVVGGRGMGHGGNFRLLEQLADLLGGQVGATRQAVDMGWAPYSSQIGLSGKTVSPRLYISFGVSGAIQHIAGMSTAEKIIAVNRDSDAPIFDVADLGIVGDVGEVLPALIRDMERRSGPCQ